MGGSNHNGNYERTDLFDSKRNDVVAPDDNFSSYRTAPSERSSSHRRDVTVRSSDGPINIYDSNVTIINDGGSRNSSRYDSSSYRDERSYRVGGGDSSYYPDFDRQSEIRRGYMEERMVNSMRPRMPIPDFIDGSRDFHHRPYQPGGNYRPAWAYEDDSSDRGGRSNRYDRYNRYDDGGVRSVSADRYDDYDRRPRYESRGRYDDYDRGSNGDYDRDYDRGGRRHNGVDQFFNSLLRAAPAILGGIAQYKLAERGIPAFYGGGRDNGYYPSYNNSYNRSYPGAWGNDYNYSY